jgi:lipopolysaccharide/colanic/teichoic acid biosynthesis glycosyltransferase
MVTAIQPRFVHIVLLILPTLAIFYIALFLTMYLWYPAGLDPADWRAHLLHFSIVFTMWLVIFYANRLFEIDSLVSLGVFLKRASVALLLCLVVAVLYFYFQPELLITPRRFLLVLLLLTSFGVLLWFSLMRLALPRGRQQLVYAHFLLREQPAIENLVLSNKLLGLQYAGLWEENIDAQTNGLPLGAIVVVPARAELSPDQARELFALRAHGVRFVEYHDFHEQLTRAVHLSALTDLWFIHSISYTKHRWFDFCKRILDLGVSCLGAIIFLATFPLLALLIKLDSAGPVLFTQKRVGRGGQIFTLYKYRTMAGGSTDTWTTAGDARITRLGKILRRLRLDELPQSLNILKGDMSIVGPRPEQVHIVEQLRQQIPYYDERHIVKPGLTGWAQLHVYAGNLEETKRKLQYDLYYIKHRSFLFDLEIILKTLYSVLSFSGR